MAGGLSREQVWNIHNEARRGGGASFPAGVVLYSAGFDVRGKIRKNHELRSRIVMFMGQLLSRLRAATLVTTELSYVPLVCQVNEYTSPRGSDQQSLTVAKAVSSYLTQERRPLHCRLALSNISRFRGIEGFYL